MILALIASLNCGFADTIDYALRDRWHEAPASVSGPWVLYINPDTGTWTMLEVSGDVACLRGAGVIDLGVAT